MILDISSVIDLRNLAATCIDLHQSLNPEKVMLLYENSVLSRQKFLPLNIAVGRHGSIYSLFMCQDEDKTKTKTKVLVRSGANA